MNKEELERENRLLMLQLDKQNEEILDILRENLDYVNRRLKGDITECNFRIITISIIIFILAFALTISIYKEDYWWTLESLFILLGIWGIKLELKLIKDINECIRTPK